MKFSTLFLMTLSAVLFSCKPLTDREIVNSRWTDVQQTGSGTITLSYVPSEGFSYYNDEGNMSGVTIELFRDFVEFVNDNYDVNISIHYQPIENFSEFYETVKTSEGGVFGVANVTITEERKDELAFSPPYLTNIATLITHRDVDKLENMNEIELVFGDLDALAFESTLHEERLKHIVESTLPDADIHFAHTNDEIIERTAAENRYFAYVDIYNYWRAAERGVPVRRHEAADEASEQFGVIMPLESDWHEVMEVFFNQNGGYVQSERYRNLLIEHLSEELADLLLAQ